MFLDGLFTRHRSVHTPQPWFEPPLPFLVRAHRCSGGVWTSSGSDIRKTHADAHGAAHPSKVQMTAASLSPWSGPQVPVLSDGPAVIGPPLAVDLQPPAENGHILFTEHQLLPTAVSGMLFGDRVMASGVYYWPMAGVDCPGAPWDICFVSRHGTGQGGRSEFEMGSTCLKWGRWVLTYVGRYARNDSFVGYSFNPPPPSQRPECAGTRHNSRAVLRDPNFFC